MRSLDDARILSNGMELPQSVERQKLDNILTDAYNEWDEGFGDRVASSFANSIAMTAQMIPGLEMIEPGDYFSHHHNRCGHFALGTMMGEEWAKPYTVLDTELWDNSLHYLLEKNIKLAEIPENGDLVAYSFTRPEDKERMKIVHFGILQVDGSFAATVMSKFSQGPVFKHLVDQIPSAYGNKAYFFRADDTKKY